MVILLGERRPVTGGRGRVFPVAPGLIAGHEPVGVVEELGDAISGLDVGHHAMTDVPLTTIGWVALSPT